MSGQQIPNISWPGNKRLLAPFIIEHLPHHRCYVEPFGGALGVLLRKEPSAVEVINDIDGDLIRFYRVVKYHLEPFMQELELVPYSRQEFAGALAQLGYTDIQRSARWLLRNKQSFGGLGKHFGTSKKVAAPSRHNFIENLRLLHKRLDRVTIENLDWREILKRYDTPETCFFCDPPYTTGTQEGYSTRWDEQAHVELRDRLLAIKGRFVLTYDDSPLVRDLYAGWRFIPVSQKKGINSGKKRGEMRQVLILQID